MKIGTLVRLSDPMQGDSAFTVAREAGFASCQLVYKPETYKAADAKAIAKAAARADVEISAQFAGFRDHDIVWDLYYGYATGGLNIEGYRQSRLAYATAAAEFAHELGLSDIIVHAGYVPNNPFAPEYALMQAAIYLLATRCKALGLNLLFETGQESPVVLLRLIQDVGTGNLFINLDTGNLLMYGYGNPVDALHTFGAYVRDVHAKDGLPPTDPRRLGPEKPLGQGKVDFPAVIAGLRALGYDRFITLEREISGEQQKRDIIAGKAYLEGLLIRGGWSPRPNCPGAFAFE